jgi:hypothetical protein
VFVPSIHHCEEERPTRRIGLDCCKPRYRLLGCVEETGSLHAGCCMSMVALRCGSVLVRPWLHVFKEECRRRYPYPYAQPSSSSFCAMNNDAIPTEIIFTANIRRKGSSE